MPSLGTDRGARSGVRLTELMAAISLATDLGTGQPLELALRTCRLSAAVAGHLGVDSGIASDIHYTALLRFLGCTADGPDVARLAGGDNVGFFAAMAPVTNGSNAEMMRTLVRSLGRDQPPLRRVRLVAGALADPRAGARSLSAHCEVGARLATRLGLGEGVVEALAHAYERWDGYGVPDRQAGEAIPFPVRVVMVARDAVLWQRLGGTQGAVDVLTRRRGHAYDPAVVDAILAIGLDTPEADDLWDEILALEPAPVRRVGEDDLDRALAAVGDFADLRAAWTRSHSSRLSALAAAAGAAYGLAEDEVTTLRRAGLVADLGAVGVSQGNWAKARTLGPESNEQVRLHPYLSERVLTRCSGLGTIAACAGTHHERLDGSGYHRGTSAPQLSPVARLLATAEAWVSLGEDRPGQGACSAGAARDLLRAEVSAGRMDDSILAAVLAAAGAADHRRREAHPGGLSDREVEVLRLIARGARNRDVAAQLSISPKTVGHHVAHIYTKIGVTTRPGAALFAMEHHLLDRPPEYGVRPMRG